MALAALRDFVRSEKVALVPQRRLCYNNGRYIFVFKIISSK